MSLKLSQLVPDGTYRIKSVLKPDHYLDYQSNGQWDVRPIVSDPKSDTQKWKIKGNTTSDDVNSYTITNVSSNMNLSFTQDKDKDGNPIWRLKAFTDGSTWTLEPRGATFVIGFVGNEQCVDYADGGGDDWGILWDRNNQVNQRWTLEPVTAGATVSPAAGTIKIVNNSAVAIEAFVTNWSNSGGNRSWFALKPGASDSWARSNLEAVMFRVQGTTQDPDTITTGVYVGPASVVNYIGVGHPGVTVTK